MNRHAKLLAFGLLTVAAWGAAWGAGCLDMTPLEVVVPVPDASLPDRYVAPPDAADGEVPDVDPRPPCEQCIEAPNQPGPGCADEIATCKADPQCARIYQCIIDNGCLVHPAQKELVTCGVPCAQDAGVISPTEPAAKLLIAIAQCGLTTCGEFCSLDGSTD